MAVDKDLSVLRADITLGSVVKRLDVVVRDSILEAQSGVFFSGQTAVGFRDGSTELVVNPNVKRVDLPVGAVPDCAGCQNIEQLLEHARPAAVGAARVAGAN